MAASRSTRVHRLFHAPRERVYRALVDAEAIARWKVPDGMTSRVHHFEGREEGRFEYPCPTRTPPLLSARPPLGPIRTVAGSSRSSRTSGWLKPTSSRRPTPTCGEMTATITLADLDGATELTAVHQGLPPGLSSRTTKRAGGWRSTRSRGSSKASRRRRGHLPFVFGLPLDVTSTPCERASRPRSLRHEASYTAEAFLDTVPASEGLAQLSNDDHPGGRRPAGTSSARSLTKSPAASAICEEWRWFPPRSARAPRIG